MPWDVLAILEHVELVDACPEEAAHVVDIDRAIVRTAYQELVISSRVVLLGVSSTLLAKVPELIWVLCLILL